MGENGTILKTSNGGSPIGYIEENASPNSTFTIYPNPASNNITITDYRKLPEESIISIFNVTGDQVMYAKFKHLTSIEMDVSMLTRGIYLVKIKTKEGIESKKLVIQ